MDLATWRYAAKSREEGCRGGYGDIKLDAKTLQWMVLSHFPAEIDEQGYLGGRQMTPVPMLHHLLSLIT